MIKTKKITTFFLLLLIFINFISCSKKLSSKEVLEKYINFLIEENYIKLYQYLSKKSKELISENEFVDFQNKDKIYKITKLNVIEIKDETNNQIYNRFKVEGMTTDNNQKTQNYLKYQTLINEDGEWKILWTGKNRSLAYNNFNQGNYDLSIEYLKKAIEINPFDSNLLQLIGTCYLRKKNYDEALKNITYSIKLEPDFSYNYNSLAIYYEDIKEYSLSIENIKKAIQFTQDDKIKSAYYANLSGINMIKKNYDEAIENIKKAIQLNEKSSVNYFRYAEILSEIGKKEDALKNYQKSLNSTDFNGLESKVKFSIYGGYSILNYDLKNYDEAKKYILMSLELEPENSYSKNLYNMILEKQKTAF